MNGLFTAVLVSLLISTACQQGNNAFKGTKGQQAATPEAKKVEEAPLPGPSADASPQGDVPPNPTPNSPEVIQVALSGCTRNFECALQGTKPGQYTATLRTPKEVFAVGEVIDLSYSDLRGDASDWITVVPADFEDNSWCQWFWAGTVSGGYRFTGLPAGRYELRAYYGWKAEGECEVIGRKRFEVR